MNAVTSRPAAKSFPWLLKREFWENRGGFLWAPVIAGGIVASLYTLLAVIGNVDAFTRDGQTVVRWETYSAVSVSLNRRSR